MAAKDYKKVLRKLIQEEYKKQVQEDKIIKRLLKENYNYVYEHEPEVLRLIREAAQRLGEQVSGPGSLQYLQSQLAAKNKSLESLYNSLKTAPPGSAARADITGRIATSMGEINNVEKAIQRVGGGIPKTGPASQIAQQAAGLSPAERAQIGSQSKPGGQGLRPPGSAGSPGGTVRTSPTMQGAQAGRVGPGPGASAQGRAMRGAAAQYTTQAQRAAARAAAWTPAHLGGGVAPVGGGVAPVGGGVAPVGGGVAPVGGGVAPVGGGVAPTGGGVATTTSPARAATGGKGWSTNAGGTRSRVRLDPKGRAWYTDPKTGAQRWTRNRNTWVKAMKATRLAGGSTTGVGVGTGRAATGAAGRAIANAAGTGARRAAFAGAARTAAAQAGKRTLVGVGARLLGGLMGGPIGWGITALSLGYMAYEMFADDDEESPGTIEDRVKQANPQQLQQLAQGARRYAGCADRDMSQAKKWLNAMKDAAKEEGVRSWDKLPYAHPARVDYRAWYQCQPIPSEQEGYEEAPPEEAEDGAYAAEPEEEAWSNPDVMYDALEMYDAMKGMGTDEEAIYSVLQKNGRDLKGLYDAFDKVLEAKNDTDAGDLIDWLRDDGENRAALMVKRAMMTMGRQVPGQEDSYAQRGEAPQGREDWVGHGIPVDTGTEY